MNRDLQPVLQHFHVCFPRVSGSNLFKSGIPSVLDAYCQSTTPVYAVFGRSDGGRQHHPVTSTTLLPLFSLEIKPFQAISESD
jgi:hypothetical protein